MLINFKEIGDINDQKISPLLLIPFIKIPKHGINNQISQGYVNLELTLAGDDLMMKVENQ
ncbi:MAG: hypothetical protein IPO26_20110 [Saprospiraceae bacterium]|nr:hypothetical protein [Saprospiraceae bacterium]